MMAPWWKAKLIVWCGSPEHFGLKASPMLGLAINFCFY
jgi:hypothetical protein